MSDSVRNIAINIRNPKKKIEEKPLPAPTEIEQQVVEEVSAPTAPLVQETIPPKDHKAPHGHGVHEVKKSKLPGKIISDLRHGATPLVSVKKILAQEEKHEPEVAKTQSSKEEDPQSAIHTAESPGRAHAIYIVPQANTEAESTPVQETVVEEASVSQPLTPKPASAHFDIDYSTLHVAYFCMEIAIMNSMPTYAGGLGILAGDMLKSCADLEVPVIGVTLIHRKGFFRQRIDASGWQYEEEEEWRPEDKLTLLPHEAVVTLEGRDVHIRAWLYNIKGAKGNSLPVIFLDTDTEKNSLEDRHITDKLYDTDRRWRLLQEAVLGIGGARMLEAIGATNLAKYHMNEGHAALLTLELYRKFAHTDEPIEEVRNRCVFTTHTPVAAGHDQFTQALAHAVLGLDYIPSVVTNAVFEEGMLNMTRLGFYFSRHINGVAKKHGEVTRELFPGYQIESITNGVYAPEWVSAPFATLFNKYLPGWQNDPHSLRYVLSIPLSEIARAHEEAKRSLITVMNDTYHADMRTAYFTIGFARRAASYKRANMLFADIERLMRIAEHSNGVQIIFAGKAHPADNEGKLVLQQVIESMRKIGHKIHCVYIEDYDIELGKLMVSGVDLWLNTPARPLEASGTSGMKAALNGVPQFSVLDGWWLEGHIENVTGWSIGPHPEHGIRGNVDQDDVEDMYSKLEHVILPLFEHEHDEWLRVMRQAIAINGSFFNSHRMVEQYVLSSYFI